MGTTNTKYSSDKKKPGKTKAFFICLLIASFLWVVHSLNTVYTYTIKVPVTFKNLPRNKKPLVQLPEHLNLDVKASGLRLALILFNKKFKPLEIDFNSLKSVNRNRNYVLSTSQLNFKSVFKFETLIKHISPDTLYFSEKVSYQKTVPIKVPLYIKCMEGYGHKKPALNFSYLTIWGDTAQLDKIDTLYTQALTLTNLNKSVNTNLDLLSPGSEVYTSVNEVNLSIEVAKLIEETIAVPVKDIHAAGKGQINIFPSTIKVTFTTLQNNFNREDTVLFKMMINSEKMDRHTNKCPVFVGTVPGNITIMNIEPKEVEILILKR
ncbi:MAG: YbbR-like domain-containing protein [bacterium]|nr:YbbR-like domain-containing protein [bacterium]